MRARVERTTEFPRAVQVATSSPRAPPSIDTSRLSVSSSFNRRPRVAPSAKRTAISRPRLVARDNRRLPALAQALSKTSAVAPSITKLTSATRIRRAGSNRECRMTVSRRGSSRPLIEPRLLSGKRFARSAPTTCRRCLPDRAGSRDRDGAITASRRSPRSPSRSTGKGTQISEARPSCSPANRSGATPISRCGRSSMMMVCPMAPSSPPNPCCQSR